MLEKCLLWLGLGWLLAGCALPFRTPAALSAHGQRVRVVKEGSFVKGCKLLGNVESDSSSDWLGSAENYRNSLNKIKNVAGRAGADIILLSTISSTIDGTGMSGEAYRCSRAKSQ